MNDEPQSPELAAAFLRSAEQFHKAAEVLVASKPFLFQPTFYCALHAIELALKAQLALDGMTVRQLRSRAYGHNLEALAAEGEKRKLINLKIRDRRLILVAAKDYPEKSFEYPSTGVATVGIGNWTNLAEDLIGSAHKALRGCNP